ncbi:auxin-induced in root cultures protein 12-like [Pyrus ussuriensis x Pyrus communis]|uniref:Cytochrome b561 and DOMON domain-containing protein n=1 Tax=Pyrus ussuriensis x Pyrus communis TaxID=2448454 RepID=A0A5N5HF03_9ROSA|nr:auxin-induced in root cultures protein 12-like [Pyrus ussuriensis x Pyrus communis]
MALSKSLFVICLLFTVSSSAAAQPPCTTHVFSNKKTFAACSTLPVLNSTIHWNYYPSTATVDIAFTQSVVSDSRWVAWAINPTSTGMVGSQAIVAYKRTDGTMTVYSSPIKSYGTHLEQGNVSFPLYDVSAVYENNEFIIFATIGLPNNVSVVHHVWQQGPMFGNTPGMHSLSGPNVQSFGTLDFLSGKTETSKGSTSTCPLKYAHGIINTISWGILMPIGIIVARYLKTVEGADPAWFHAHRGCQMLAFLGGIAGWGTGIFLGSKSPGIQYKGHRCIGITLFVLATIQVAVALCLRPKKTDENRKYWNWFHWVVGYGTFVLSITNIFKGFDILEPANKWKFAYIAIIGTLGCIAAILELRKLGSFLSRFRSSRAAGPEIVESTQTIV